MQVTEEEVERRPEQVNMVWEHNSNSQDQLKQQYDRFGHAAGMVACNGCSTMRRCACILVRRLTHGSSWSCREGLQVDIC